MTFPSDPDRLLRSLEEATAPLEAFGRMVRVVLEPAPYPWEETGPLSLEEHAPVPPAARRRDSSDHALTGRRLEARRLQARSVHRAIGW